MRPSLPLKAVLVALLVAALAVPSVAAVSGVTASVRTPATAASSGSGLLAQAWSWLTSMWSDAAGPSAGQSGTRAPSAPSVHPDAGCIIDPDGKCRVSAIASGF
jgi:hypothetical protein